MIELSNVKDIKTMTAYLEQQDELIKTHKAAIAKIKSDNKKIHRDIIRLAQNNRLSILENTSIITSILSVGNDTHNAMMKAHEYMLTGGVVLYDSDNGLLYTVSDKGIPEIIGKD